MLHRLSCPTWVLVGLIMPDMQWYRTLLPHSGEKKELKRFQKESLLLTKMSNGLCAPVLWKFPQQKHLCNSSNSCTIHYCTCFHDLFGHAPSEAMHLTRGHTQHNAGLWNRERWWKKRQLRTISHQGQHQSMVHRLLSTTPLPWQHYRWIRMSERQTERERRGRGVGKSMTETRPK